MVIVDANVILRIVLRDNEDMVSKAEELLSNNNFFIKREVLVEIIYVLSKTYKMERVEIAKIICGLLEADDTIVESKNAVHLAIEIYKNRSLDFVDCLLYAYQKVEGEKVFTFDKKLNKLLEVADIS
jgi:predicted nucleic-acid-binding protein